MSHWYALAGIEVLAAECESNQGQHSLKHTLNAVLLCNLSCPFRSLGVGTVPHGNIGTNLSKPMSHLKTNASTRTSDNSSLALQREHTQQAGVGRGGGVLVDKMSSVINGVVRHGDKIRLVSGVGMQCV